MFCLTRPTAMIASSSTTPALSFVPTAKPPKFVLPARPFTLAPAMIGTSCPSTSPMRRLKYRQDVFAQPETEPEDIVSLEEERALLGKEERKPREVRAPRVDFGFRKVRVDGQRRDHVRAEPLRDVQARLKLSVDIIVRCRHPAAGCNGRPDGEPTTQIELRQPSDQPGAARLRDLILTRRKRPSIGFELPLNPSLDVEVPFAQVGIEAEGLNGIQISALHPFGMRAVAASQMPSQSDSPSRRLD